MKIILFSIFFCILFSVNLFAQKNLLPELLDLPAPPPSNKTDGEEKRPPQFYEDKNPPDDDAPIEDLLDYWQVKAGATYSGADKPLTASIKTSRRLIETIEAEPSKFNDFLKILPKDAEVLESVKRLYDAKKNSEDVNDYWREQVRGWLKFNSNFYVEELLSDASSAKDHPNYSTINKENELRALVKLEWEKAKPLLERLENDKANPRTATLAKILFYEHSLAGKDALEAEKYRSQLKEIVTGKTNPPFIRNSAMDALASEDWQGQDDWYLSLMEDETLLNPTENYSLYSPLTTITEKNPDKWIPVLTKLVGSKKRAVHNAAVQGLMSFKNRKDALEPLLAWLSNPDWTDIHWSGSDRVAYMQMVVDVDLPESVPGLIWIIENDEENIHWAARSLAHYKDARAIPALKSALEKSKEENDRNEIINALIAGGALSDEEQLSALEVYAEFAVVPGNLEKVENRSDYEDENPLPVAVSIGKFLVNQKEPGEGLIARLIERLKILQKEKPAAAKFLSGVMSKWKNRLVDLEMLKRVADGNADVETIVGALARRKELRERVSGEIDAMRGSRGLSSAMAACLSEDEGEIISALRSRDAETQIAVLACARLIRAKIPVPEAGDLLKSSNKLLALAAERYLESEDSREARNLVLSQHAGEALILGARDSFNPAKVSEFPPVLKRLFASVNSSYSNSLHPEQNAFAAIDKFENKLRDEIKANADLLEIYAIFPSYVVRVYRDRTIFSWYENAARYREAILPKKDFDELKQFLTESNLEETPPMFGGCHYNCGLFEYARFNRDGGRRFFAYTGFESFVGMAWKFQALRESERMKIRYYLQDKIAGLEILLTDNKFKPRAVWKNGDDFRVLVADEERRAQIDEEIARLDKIDEKNEDLDYRIRGVKARKRRAEREFEHYEWRELKSGKLGGKVDEPVAVPFLRDKLLFPSVEDLRDNESIRQARYGDYVVRVGSNYENYGLWKANRFETIKIADGWFGGNPIVSGDWAVAAKTGDNWAVPNYVVRVNLKTGRELKINLPPADNFEPVAFVTAHNKVLLRRAADADTELKKDNPSPSTPEYYLLDADTGKTKLVSGEFQPLVSQTFRSLQPAGKPSGFWATVYNREKNETAIGLYDAKNFTFKAILNLPEILLDSMEVWVDEKEAKIYFVYAGDFGGETHLLSLPLPREQ